MNDFNSTRRLPAEWEPQGGVIVSWPHAGTDWAYMLDEVTECFARIVTAIAEEQPVVVIVPDKNIASPHLLTANQNNILYVELPTNDTWARDFGPLSVTVGDKPVLLDFGFNGWGLKFAADKDNLVNLRLNEKGIIAPLAYRNERDFVLEGGSVESDGQGTVMTTSRCLQSPNRNGGKTKAELNRELLERLGADHVLWLDHGALEGDDTDSHIDTLARLAPDDTIVFTGTRNFDDPQFESLLAMRAQLTLFRTAEGNPYNLVELPLPDPVLDPDGHRLPATYANYLVANGVIFMPTYAQPDKDELAMRSIQIAFPGHKVVGVDCRTLLRQHGSLHCATMQIPAGIINL